MSAIVRSEPDSRFATSGSLARPTADTRRPSSAMADPLDLLDVGPRLPQVHLANRAGRKSADDVWRICRTRFTRLVRQMPKVELHAHIEGSVRPKTILKLARKYGVDLPFKTADELQRHIRMNPGENLLDFLKKFESFRFVFDSKDMLKTIAYEAVKENASENVVYTEFQMNPWKHPDKVSIGDEIDAVLAGLHAAKHDFGVDARFLVSLNRSYPLASAWQVAREAVKRKDRGVVGIALAGDEVHFPAEKFKPIFDFAHANGLKVVIHAGEAQGPKSIDGAVRICKADRLDHGTRLIEDKKLMRFVRDRGIYMGMAITSNYQLGVVRDLKKYPLRYYLQQGLRAGMNTDDRAIFDTTLTQECMIAADKMDMSLQDIQRTMLFGAQAAFLPKDEQAALVDKMARRLRKMNASLTRLRARQ